MSSKFERAILAKLSDETKKKKFISQLSKMAKENKALQDIVLQDQGMISDDFRRILPQELWDKTSQYYGSPSDWNHMNTIMATRDSSGNIHYPYSKDSPAFKKHVAIRNMQKRFRQDRVPYGNKLKDNTLEEEDIQEMLHQGKIRSADVALKKIWPSMHPSEQVAFVDEVIGNMPFDIARLDWEKARKAIPYLIWFFANHSNRERFGRWVSQFEGGLRDRADDGLIMDEKVKKKVVNVVRAEVRKYGLELPE
jgi:hypothetical protein